jgi:hypothetical protein
MKRRANSTAAIALASLGALLILGLTGLVVVVVLTVGSLGNVDCQSCHDLSGTYTAAKVTGGVGALVAAVTFWGIFKSLRPQKGAPSK